MKHIKLFCFLILIFSCNKGFTQPLQEKGSPVPVTFCISPAEFKLYTMINDYRARYGLTPIPLSKSLSYVAALHVKDLSQHHPDKGSCNSHSWSEYGNWKPFCYPRDENKKSSVWDKPKELTRYKGKGFEIVYWENSAAIIDSIIAFWKSVDYFNSFLMNTGKWNGKKWNALGIAIYENYAAAWFGEVPDHETTLFVCGTAPPPVVVNQEGIPSEGQKKEPPETKGKKVDPKKKDPVGPESSKKGETGTSEKAKKQVQSDPSEVLTNPTGRFYIIVKSLSPRNEMNKAMVDFKKQGYSDTKLIDKEGKLRLSVCDYELKSSADSALREIKKSYLDAWILKY